MASFSGGGADIFLDSLSLIPRLNRYCFCQKHPERILADKICRNRENLSYCETNGIHMNGPKLGRPPKDKQLYEEQKRQERTEA
ncbi:MAG: hypothetical protein SCM11_08745 [Bacillota bacterium]|nr:hypothetical protein [Bacillota bacterium]